MVQHSATIVLRFACILVASSTAAAHGWIKSPAARNLIAQGQNGFYDIMSLNRMGGASTGGVCGGLFSGDDRFSVGGAFASRAISANWTAGSTVEIAVQIYTNHWGRFEFRLCPLSVDSDAAETAELSEDCLESHPLTLADGSGRYVTPQGSNDAEYLVTNQWKLPEGITCDRCVLQWRWVTGHMCVPEGADDSYIAANYAAWNSHLAACGSDYLDPMALPPEKFWNCADVKITGSGGASSTPTAAAPAAAKPTPVLAPAVATSDKATAPVSGKDKPVTVQKADTGATPAPVPEGCTDVVPPGGFNCNLQKSWGKCGQAWMAAGGYCATTCGGCTTAPPPATATATSSVSLQRQTIHPKCSKTTCTLLHRATLAPTEDSSLETAGVFEQCGGQYGGIRCNAKPSGEPQCTDAAWSWVKCTAGTSCTRINTSYWQCRNG